MSNQKVDKFAPTLESMKEDLKFFESHGDIEIVYKLRSAIRREEARLLAEDVGPLEAIKAVFK